MIGLIDSGSGGLSVLTALRREMPDADVLYFGDIKNAPYGNKSHAELSRLTIDALSLLKERGVTNVVSACNSVSAALAISLFDTLLSAQHVIEMVGPTVATLKDETRSIAICATEATIRSGMYENGFRMVGKRDITSIAIPDLAGQIEFGASKEVLKQTISTALAPHQGTFSVLVLACTHYPLVRDLFVDVVGDAVEIVDPAESVATRAKGLFTNEKTGQGRTTFLISQESACFREYVAELLLAGTYQIEVVS
jgi:glutamate racemase